MASHACMVNVPKFGERRLSWRIRLDRTQTTSERYHIDGNYLVFYWILCWHWCSCCARSAHTHGVHIWRCQTRINWSSGLEFVVRICLVVLFSATVFLGEKRFEDVKQTWRLPDNSVNLLPISLSRIPAVMVGKADRCEANPRFEEEKLSPPTMCDSTVTDSWVRSCINLKASCGTPRHQRYIGHSSHPSILKILAYTNCWLWRWS